MQSNLAQPPPGVREGDVLAGKYRIETILGAGGMGVVVAAHHIQLDEKVAIKFLLPQALSNEEAVARFAREARAAVKIKSEHVARIIDVGTLETGAPYMVMEYLEGGDLSAWLAQRGPLPIEQAAEFILQACEAIADAHGLGIVHRDLKPSNLFCIRRSDGLLSIKVLDFGISKVTTAGNSEPPMNMTSTTAVMGSPVYMSPEQMQSARDVDARTDIWAIGVILYEMLTGKLPFDGDTISEVCVKAALQPPLPIRDRRPDAPLEIETVILKCLEKRRENRYGNVAELALALAPFGPKRSRATVERISRIIQSAGLSTSQLALPPSLAPVVDRAIHGTQSAWGRTKSGHKWSRVGVIAGGALLGVATIISLIWLFGGLGRGGAQRADASDPATAARVVPDSTASPLAIPADAGAVTVQPMTALAVTEHRVIPLQAGVLAADLAKPKASSDGKTSSKSSSVQNPTGNPGMSPVVHPSIAKNSSHNSPSKGAPKDNPSSALGGRL